MPFTFAHPAIILPLRTSKKFSMTALIAGSIVPDFEFFFQMRLVENIGHHWYGIVLFDLPVAWMICFLFHNLMRNALVTNLPSSLRSRLVDLMAFDWNQYARNNRWTVVLSLFTGIASHILWDSFTHFDGLFVEMIPVMSADITVSSFRMPVYFLLQVLFSVLGLASVLRVICSLPKQEWTYSTGRHTWYWPLFLGILFVILMIRLAGWPQYNSFWGIFMAVMGGTYYASLLVSCLFINHSFKKATS